MPTVHDLSPEDREEFEREIAARHAADRGLLRLLMAEHTGAWVTAGYVVLSLLGLLHEAMVLRRFGINFVEYAQLADFLLAAIRDPFVVLASVIPGALVYGFYVWLGRWKSTRNPAKFLEGRRKNPRMSDPRLMAGLQLLTGVVGDDDDSSGDLPIAASTPTADVAW